MLSELSTYLREHWEEFGLSDRQDSNLSFFKVGGNPWNKGRVNFLIFGETQIEPVLFAKFMREKNQNDSIKREYSLINKLASNEKLAAFLPLPIRLLNLTHHDVIIQKACHGVRMISSLSKSPILLFQKDKIVSNFSYALKFVILLNKYIKNHLEQTEFKRTILDPIVTFYKEYEPLEQKNFALAKSLDQIYERMKDYPFSTPLHGDYSATNIFIESKNQIKIIDWETATENGLPFWDLFYFISKYIHNLKILPKNRWQRVQQCYFGNNWLSKLIRETVYEYCRQTGFSIELARILFPLHFLIKAKFKYSMRGKEPAQLWMNLFEFSLDNSDKLCF